MNKVLVDVPQGNAYSIDEVRKLLSETKAPTEPDTSPPDPPTATSEVVIPHGYSFLASANYSSALQKLRTALPEGNAFHPLVGGYARPLSSKETLQSLVDDFNTLTNPDGTKRSPEDRNKLFLQFKDTCTGIHYCTDNKRFLIIPICDRLITLDKAFNEPFVNVPYGTIGGVELQRKKAKYNQLLAKPQVLDHEGWLALVDGDRNLLQAYADIAFSLKEGNLMGFWLRDSVTGPELRAVFLNSFDYNFNANGINSLNSLARFLLKTPSSSQKILSSK